MPVVKQICEFIVCFHFANCLLPGVFFLTMYSSVKVENIMSCTHAY
jgi:hypothetical protein